MRCRQGRCSLRRVPHGLLQALLRHDSRSECCSRRPQAYAKGGGPSELGAPVAVRAVGVRRCLCVQELTWATTGGSADALIDHRVECEQCGRRFAADRSAKHAIVCTKVRAVAGKARATRPSLYSALLVSLALQLKSAKPRKAFKSGAETRLAGGPAPPRSAAIGGPEARAPSLLPWPRTRRHRLCQVLQPQGAAQAAAARPAVALARRARGAARCSCGRQGERGRRCCVSCKSSGGAGAGRGVVGFRCCGVCSRDGESNCGS